MTKILTPFVDNILTGLREALGHPGKAISLNEPEFKGNEWTYVKECLDTGWVSSVGKFVDRFEQELASYTGAKYAIAVVNGTAALHICLKLAGVKPGDEVLVPTLTFIATVNAIDYCGAIPHFVDSDETTLGLDPTKLGNYLEEIAEVRAEGCFNKKTGRCIRVVLPMHTFGHPVDLDPLMEVCRRFRIELVEDAAESLGSSYKGKHTGNFGKVSALSFNGNKIITTGGGGAILTNDAALAKLAKHLTTTARVPHKWSFVHDQVGFNYRLPNINAALGCAQLEQLPGFLIAKRRLFGRYQQAFAKVPHTHIVMEPNGCSSNYWLQTMLLDESVAEYRDAILEASNDEGLMTRPAWALIHQSEPYRSCPRMDLSVAESLERRLINLPSSPFLVDP